VYVIDRKCIEVETTLKAGFICVLCCMCCCPVQGAPRENLCFNGDFNLVTNGLPTGWACDWSWAGNSFRMNNARYIEIR